jgi:hypothetical protein
MLKPLWHQLKTLYPTLRAGCSFLFFLNAKTAQSVKRVGHWAEDQGIKVRFPAGTRDFCFIYNVQTRCGNNPTSYPVGAGA